MYKPSMIDYELEFEELDDRDFTDMIVVHHTGDPVDDNLSAEEIHESHKNQGWAGIGYHFVIRKNGQIEVGRPMDAVGSHAYGENRHTVGIHVCGNFNLAKPTVEQIESLAALIAWVAEQYDIDIDIDTVVGHCDLMATSCPGVNLENDMQLIRGKAIWYQQNYPKSKGYV